MPYVDWSGKEQEDPELDAMRGPSKLGLPPQIVLYRNPDVDNTLRNGTPSLPFITAEREGFGEYDGQQDGDGWVDCATERCGNRVLFGYQAENGDIFCDECVVKADVEPPYYGCAVCTDAVPERRALAITDAHAGEPDWRPDDPDNGILCHLHDDPKERAE